MDKKSFFCKFYFIILWKNKNSKIRLLIAWIMVSWISVPKISEIQENLDTKTLHALRDIVFWSWAKLRAGILHRAAKMFQHCMKCNQDIISFRKMYTFTEIYCLGIELKHFFSEMYRPMGNTPSSPLNSRGNGVFGSKKSYGNE